jgi:hypothetical protein
MKENILYIYTFGMINMYVMQKDIKMAQVIK